MPYDDASLGVLWGSPGCLNGYWPNPRDGRRKGASPKSRFSANMAEGTSPKLSNVADVEIDANRRFKYVLIKVIDNPADVVYKYIVKGFSWAGYHGRLPTQSNST